MRAARLVLLSVVVALAASPGIGGEPGSPDEPLAGAAIEGLRSPDAATRLSAARELGSLRSATGPAVTALARGLSDADPFVRMACAGSLGEIGPLASGAVTALVRALRDGVAGVRLHAASALSRMGARAAPAVESLKGLLADPDEEVRRQAAWAVDRIASAVAEQPAGTLTRRPEGPPAPKVDLETPPAAAGGEPKSPSGRPPKTSRGGRTDRPETVEDWIRRLGSPDAAVRREAATALGVIGPRAKAAVPHLERAKEDSDAAVRRAAADALDRIRGVRPARRVGAAAGVAQPPKIEGRLYYFPLYQVPTEDGPVPIEPLPSVNGTSFGLGPIVAALDLAEVAEFREELRKQGSPDADLPLASLVAKHRKELQHPCTDPILARIDWDDQRTYRLLWGEHRIFVGAAWHAGHVPGEYRAAVSVITSRGLRIDDVLHFRVDAASPETLRQEQDQRRDLAKMREEFALPLPPESDETARRFAEDRRRRFREELPISFCNVARLGMDTGRASPEEIEGLLAGGVEALRELVTERPGDFQIIYADVTMLPENCVKLGNAAAYRLAARVARLAERVFPRTERSCLVALRAVHLNLAHLAISSGADVSAAWEHLAKSYAFYNLAWPDRPLALPPCPVFPGGEEWTVTVDLPAEEEPAAEPPPARPEDATTEEGGGETPGDGESAGGPGSPATGEPSSEDEERARAIRWQSSIDDALADAERKMALARAQLALQRMAAAKVRARISDLEFILSKDTAGDEDLFETVTRYWDKLWDTPPPAEPAATLRKAVEKRIVELREELAAVLRQQDEEVAGIGEVYDRILDELEARGGKLPWADLKEKSDGLRKRAATQQELAGLHLFLASGQREKFQEAARRSVDAKVLAPVAHLLQGLDFLENRERRGALNALHQCLEGDPNNPLAKSLIQDIEVGYLRAIDAKAMGDAAAVRAACERRLAAHGEPGWWGTVKDLFTAGVTTIVSGLSGDLEAFGELSGTMQSESAREHAGLLLITRLREKALTFDEIRSLTNERFIEVVTKEFQLTNVTITPEDAKRMRAAMEDAFRNVDVDRIVNHSRLQLDVDTGRSYHDTEIFEQEWYEGIGEAVNLKNLIVMLGPMAVVKAGGEIATVGSWGWTGAATEKIVTVKDVFSGLLRLPALADKMGANWVVEGLMKFDRTAGTVTKMLGDSLIQMAVVRSAKALGGETGEFLAEVLTSYGVGDLDNALKILRDSGLRASQLNAVAKHLSETLTQANDVLARSRALSSPVDAALAEMSGTGKLSKAASDLLDDADAQVSKRLEDLAKQIEAGDVSPVLVHEAQRLGALRQSIVSVRAGRTLEAKALKEIGEKMDGVLGEQVSLLSTRRQAAEAIGRKMGADDLVSTARKGGRPDGPAPLRPVEEAVHDPALQSRNLDRTLSEMDEGYWASGGRGGVPDGPALAGPPNFRQYGPFSDADRLFLEDKFDEAVEAYRRHLVALDALGKGGDPVAYELARKLRLAKRARAGAARWEWETDDFAPSPGAFDVPVAKAEIDQVLSDPAYRLRKVAEESASSPFWVEQFDGKGWRKVGIAKQSPDGSGFDFKAERIYRDLARESGVAVPECSDDVMHIVVTKKVGDVDVEAQVPALFVRYVDGTDLSHLDLGTQLALKRQMAEDRVLAAVLGDYDRKMGNYLVTKEGKLVSIDHGMANLGQFSRRPDLQKSILANGGGAHVDEILADMESGFFGVTHWRQRAEAGLDKARAMGATAAAAEEAEAARRILTLEKAITYEEMEPAIRRLKESLTDEKLLGILQKQLSGDELRLAFEVLKVRRDNLDKVLRKCYLPIDQLSGRLQGPDPVSLRKAA